MTIKFTEAKRSDTHLLLGLAGPSGSGKTLSALRIARGLCGDDESIYVIDTENGRAGFYAYAKGESEDPLKFRFKHGLLGPPFSPQAYGEALKAAVKAGAKVVIVDSASHEHEGEGGILEMHEAELTRMAGDDFRKRERVKFAAWIKPKLLHTRYVNLILQQPVHVIFCFRAKEKLELVKNADGKTVPVPMGWTPICPDRLDYEMADILVLPPNSEGVPDLDARATKLYAHHKGIFKAGRQLCEDVGKELAAWAAGKKGKSKPASEPDFEDEVKSADMLDHYAALLKEAADKPALKALAKTIAEDPDLLPEDKKELRAAYQARSKEVG